MTSATPLDCPENLVDFVKVQRQAIDNLERLREIGAESGVEAEELDLIDEMLDRVEQQRFTVAIVGEFKRGKSTLVNALLGENVLPSDVLPATAALNRVTYDLRKFGEVRYKDGQTSHEVPFDQLKDYVTQLTPEAKERAATIEQVVIHYDNHFLRKNVDIVDTPGLNDTQMMTAVTLSVLPRIDAAIMVISAEAPFSGVEGDFLNQLLLSDLGRVMFVVNKIDEVDEEDRPRLKDAIRKRIRSAVESKADERFGSTATTQDERQLHVKRIGEPQVFLLAAWPALTAKERGDPDQLAESQFIEFEQALERFLANGRGIVQLQSLAARIIASGSRIHTRLMQELGASQMTASEFEKVYNEAEERFTELEQQLQAELRRIDTAIEKTRQLVRPIVGQLGNDMQQAAAKVIEEARISSADIGPTRQPVTLERLGQLVNAATDNAGRVVAERAQFVIQKEVELQLEQISTFATAVDRSLHAIDLRFSRPIGDDPNAVGVKGNIIQSVISGSLFSGGLIGTLYATTIIGPIVLPLFVGIAGAIGLASLLTGRVVKDLVFTGARVESFRKAYRDSVLNQIDQQVRAQAASIEHMFDEHVRETFESIQRNIRREMSSTLDQQRQTLDDLRARRERNEAISELQREEMQRKIAEVDRILGKAHGLSATLRDVRDV